MGGFQSTEALPEFFLWLLFKLTSSISVVYLGLHSHLHGDDDQSGKYECFVIGLAITSHAVEKPET